MDPKQQILDELEPLFVKARKDGLWFYSSYQAMWFSPDELEKEHNDGRLIWGVANWQLLDPKDEIERLARQVTRAKKRLEAFKLRVHAND